MPRSDASHGAVRHAGARHVRRGLITGALVFGACAAIEWVVLFIKVPPSLSSRLIFDLVWNVCVYALIGAVVGGLAGALAGLPGRRANAPGSRANALGALRHAPWALVMAGALALYWVFAANRLYPGSSREPTALALSGAAVLAAAGVGLFLLLRAGRWKGLAVPTLLILAVLWLPLYILSAEPALERTRGGVPRPEEVSQVREGSPNVVLVMLDTTRADCLGCYGSTECPTPRLDALALESALFEQCVSLEPLTRPMTCTLFTGFHPRRHGVDANTKTLDPGFDTLAESFVRAGYSTAAFTAASVLSGYYGTAQGFELYSEPSEPWWYMRSDLAIRRLYISLTQWGNWWVEIRADEVTSRAGRWIRSRSRDRDRPFFAFVHYFDPHAPYDPPARFDLAARDGVGGVAVPYEYESQRFEDGFEMPEAFVRQEWRRYQGEIAFVDEQVGRLLDVLGETGVADDTILIVVGDHGESFAHGYYFAHEYRLYDALVHVPLLVRWPERIRPSRIPTQVTLADVAPTILSLASVPASPEAQAAPAPDGNDLAGLLIESGVPGGQADGLDGAGGLSPAFCQTNASDDRPFYGWTSNAVRAYPWKYIESPEVDLRELYNLETDPGELNNLVGDEPERAREMATVLSEWLEQTERFAVEPEDLSPRRIEELRSLGYLQ